MTTDQISQIKTLDSEACQQLRASILDNLAMAEYLQTITKEDGENRDLLDAIVKGLKQAWADADALTAEASAFNATEKKVLKAIARDCHDAAEIMRDQHIETEYTALCHALAQLTKKDQIECRKEGYFLTQNGWKTIYNRIIK